MVRYLLTLKTFDVNSPTGELNSPLHLVCNSSCKEVGQLNTIELLLKKKDIDLDATDRNGEKALQLYLRNSRHLEPLQKLGAGTSSWLLLCIDPWKGEIHRRILLKAKKSGYSVASVGGKRKTPEPAVGKGSSRRGFTEGKKSNKEKKRK